MKLIKGTTRAWDADIEEGLTTKQENSFLGEKVESKLYEKGWLHKNGGENDGC